ncbi:Palmitoyltransferase pfa5 [Lecanosticta acicola]|uniref:Palmitoyltransferase n=1 Tax=Lecanosticta acicola TaxID=111012 RepID=A0AAI8YUB0_9PEZI|nr:Palmitoyltransferase pfa5 [Lecanosticta acicola]
MDDRNTLHRRNRASIWTARITPIFLALIVAYVSYVVVGPLCIDYLVNPPGHDIPRRLTAGIALAIVHFVLLIPVATSYLRLLLVLLLDPGFIPRGPEVTEPSDIEARPGCEAYWNRQVFACDPSGLPIWCDQCHNWKPDRTHHSQDAGRCTRKMDHFCPWVGGVVGERSMKFFIQFLVYSMILTSYLTIVLAYFVAQYKDDVQLFVGLGLSGFFCLFTTGMVMNSVHLVLQNATTIENAGRRMHLAVLLPPELQKDPLPPPPPVKPSPPLDSDVGSERPQTSDFDDPSHHNYFSRQANPAKRTRNSSSVSAPRSKLWRSSVTYPLHWSVDRPPLPAPTARTFAILKVPPGANPWNLGSAYRNFTAVFGFKLHEWLLPLNYSPCCDHSSAVSEYPLGPEFELLLVDAGLVRPQGSSARELRPSSARSSRRRKRRLDLGWQNGERPDGWMSEKEARRLRNEWRRRAEREQHPDAQ